MSDLCKGMLAWIAPVEGGLTVRVGSPTLVPRSGEQLEGKVVLALKPVSWVQSGIYAAPEDDWFNVPDDEQWLSATDARVTEADWIRLFHPIFDACLAYEVRSRVSATQALSRAAIRERMKEGWMQSVFAFLPPWTEWPHEPVPQPDDQVAWISDSRVICGWFHWALLGGPMPFRTANPWGAGPFVRPSDAEEREGLAKVRSAVASIQGAEMIEPRVARHMVAIVGSDPLDDVDFATFRTAEVVHQFETIPSPVRPDARRFRLTVAWRSTHLEELRSSLSAFRSESPSRFLDWSVQAHGSFVSAEATFEAARILERPTFDILQECASLLGGLIEHVRHGVPQAGQPQTQSYWGERHGVTLGVSWRDSEKNYAWQMTDDGSLLPISSDEFLGEEPKPD